MPREKVISEEDMTKNILNDEEINTPKKQNINVDDLTGRVCYFSLTGDQALDAFEKIKVSTFNKKRQKLKQELFKRLVFAILMFDKVVMHCSDPLRKEIVLEILEENVQWIENERIVFIFSNHITDIRNDYKTYIDTKIKEYSDGYYSEKEAASLNQPHMTEEYYKRVITLLEKSPCIIRKSTIDTLAFDKLVLDDLEAGHNEQVIVDSTADLSQILTLNLTLFQLLNSRQLICGSNESKSKGEFVFPHETVESVSNMITEHLEQGNTVSRSAIVDALEDGLKPKHLSKKQKNILSAITLRMDVLYCKMNSGKQLILEFHPSYEGRSIYQTDCFFRYIKEVTGNDKQLTLTPEIVNRILEEENVDQFRFCYLSCMADTHEHMKLVQTNMESKKGFKEEFTKTFIKVMENNQVSKISEVKFGAIKNIFKEAK